MIQAGGRRKGAAINGKAANDSDRVALVDHLWKLKKHWQNHTGDHVPLNVLIKEVEYRRDVLRGAANSGKPELESLARRILEIEKRIGEIRSLTEQAPQKQPRSLWAAMSLSVVALLVTGSYMIYSAFFKPEPGYVSLLPAENPDIAFRLHGSNTVGEELAPALLKGFFESRNALENIMVGSEVPVEKQFQFVLPEHKNSARAVELHAHGSSTAFRDLAAGTADMGMSSRPIKTSEVEKLKAQYGDLSSVGSEHVIALDGLAVIVNPNNPVQALTKAQVAAIFSGQVKDWSELGGLAGLINLYARDDNSGTFDTFKSLVLKANGVELDGAARRIESSTELSDAVAADPAGIGFIGLPYVRNARALGIAESVETLPIVPTEFTVGTEDYPLSRRLYFYMPANTDNRDIRDFVEFTLSDAGQQIVEKTGLVSQRVRAERTMIGSTAPAEFRRLALNAERLSVTLRFVPGSDALDNKSLRDINRVVEFMKENRGREMLLFGFTDNAGDADVNRQLSQSRAKAVEQLFIARGIYPRTVEGFGGAMPVASNETGFGRQKNRRVEIWVR